MLFNGDYGFKWFYEEPIYVILFAITPGILTLSGVSIMIAKRRMKIKALENAEIHYNAELAVVSQEATSNQIVPNI